MNTSTRWKALVALGLFALVLGASSAAAASKPADCVLAERDKPTLNAQWLPSARFRMITEPIGWERDGAGKQIELTLRHGEETAELADGIMLRVSLGGCESYTNSYAFWVPDGPDVSDGAWWLARASALLREIAPANLDRMVPLPALADILAGRAKDPGAARDLTSAPGSDPPATLRRTCRWLWV